MTNSPLDSLGPVFMLQVRKGCGGPCTDKLEAGRPCQVLTCGTLALANLNRLEYREPAFGGANKRTSHDKPDHPGRSVRLHHLRRHRRSLRAQAPAGALPSPARPPVFRADPHHRRITQQDERRRVPRLRQEGDPGARSGAVCRRGRAERVPGPAELRFGRRQERRRLRQAEEDARPQRRHPGVLPGGRARPVRRHIGQAQRSTVWSRRTRASSSKSRSGAIWRPRRRSTT